jgi:hypothetical protein
MPAPCESCPCKCAKCAWLPVGEPDGRPVVKEVRSAGDYGCVAGGRIVVTADGTPAMDRGGSMHFLSPRYGHVLRGTQLERDLAVAVA